MTNATLPDRLTEPIDVTTTAVTIRDEPTGALTLYGTDDPEAIVQVASRRADVLSRIIEKQQLYTDIRGRKHINVEAWTTCGSLSGVFAVEDWIRPLEDGSGWQARVVAQTLRGEIVGAAEAICQRSEGKPWDTADDHALASMAQTRATSKALRIPLGWIVTLAGYATTPAEEMTDTDRSETPPQRPVEARSAPKAPQTTLGTADAPQCSHGYPMVLRNGRNGAFFGSKHKPIGGTQDNPVWCNESADYEE